MIHDLDSRLKLKFYPLVVCVGHLKLKVKRTCVVYSPSKSIFDRRLEELGRGRRCGLQRVRNGCLQGYSLDSKLQDPKIIYKQNKVTLWSGGDFAWHWTCDPPHAKNYHHHLFLFHLYALLLSLLLRFIISSQWGVKVLQNIVRENIMSFCQSYLSSLGLARVIRSYKIDRWMELLNPKAVIQTNIFGQLP
jgi:hypothetical protein